LQINEEILLLDEDKSKLDAFFPIKVIIDECEIGNNKKF